MAGGIRSRCEHIAAVDMKGTAERDPLQIGIVVVKTVKRIGADLVIPKHADIGLEEFF